MKDEMIHFEPRAGEGAMLRRAFGQFGTGVTIVTAMTDRGPLGMTANSFSSVSLAPPLVLWSAAKRSKRHDAFAKAQHYCIHVLGSDQVALANHFATEGEAFESFDWVKGPDGAPTLPGCLAAFQCNTYAVHPAGDHSLIVGEITHAAVTDRTLSGLIFHKGTFGAFVAEG
ncbi:MAG: flavin reductase family protein [Sulfitobacter sp.]|nr:flavin reductase family protein [Sulfitobacter sp.]